MLSIQILLGILYFFLPLKKDAQEIFNLEQVIYRNECCMSYGGVKAIYKLAQSPSEPNKTHCCDFKAFDHKERKIESLAHSIILTDPQPSDVFVYYMEENEHTNSSHSICCKCLNKILLEQSLNLALHSLENIDIKLYFDGLYHFITLMKDKLGYLCAELPNNEYYLLAIHSDKIIFIPVALPESFTWSLAFCSIDESTARTKTIKDFSSQIKTNYILNAICTINDKDGNSANINERYREAYSMYSGSGNENENSKRFSEYYVDIEEDENGVSVYVRPYERILSPI